MKKLILPTIFLSIIALKVTQNPNLDFQKNTPSEPVPEVASSLGINPEPTPTAEPQQSPLIQFAVQAAEPKYDDPIRVTIPAINLESDIVSVGLNDQRIVDTPTTLIGWYNRMARPGEPGNFSLNGHFLNANLTPGIFHNASKLKPGDAIIMTDKQNRSFTYRVTGSELVTVQDFPLQKVYGKSSEATMNIVTCAGNYDQRTRDYTMRTIVYASLEKV